jgi:hypothetical protein
MSTRDSNRSAVDVRAASVLAERIMQQALLRMENLHTEYQQKKEEKWTREWAVAEVARQRGIQFYRLSSLKNYEKILWKPGAVHLCGTQCQQYSNRGPLIYRFSMAKSMPARNNVYICMETGSVHLCDLSRCNREYGINGTHKKLASACIISGKLKAPFLSAVRFGDNGIGSTKGMADAEHREEDAQREDEVHQEDDDAMREDESEEGEGKKSKEPGDEEEAEELENSEEEDNLDLEIASDFVTITQKAKRVRLAKSDIVVTALEEAKRDITNLDNPKAPTIVKEKPPNFSTASKKERTKMNELKAMSNNEKKRKQSEEPVFVFSKTRAITVHQTLEQKLERYLKKGSPHAAENFLDMLVAAHTKNCLTLYRSKVLSKEVTRELIDLLSQYELPMDIAVGIYHRRMRSTTKMEFYYPPVTFNMKLYSKYILLHWEAAARTLYADTPTKPKHGQLMHFQSFCIGVIYCMANGGMLLEEKLEPRRPGLLGEREQQVLIKIRLNIQEIPSFPELQNALVNKEFLHELHKCVGGFPVLQMGVEENAQQFLRNYVNSRRTAIREHFYASLEAEPLEFKKHLELYLAASRPLRPAEE